MVGHKGKKMLMMTGNFLLQELSVLMHLCYRDKTEPSRAFTERIGICRQNALPIKFKQADDKITQSICSQSYENSLIQAILNNMNSSQLSDKLQSVEKVIQFCQEKNL